MTRRSVDDLKLSPEVAWFLESRGIPFPDIPPTFRTPEPRLFRGARFDPERVDRVLASFGALRHTKGKWSGQPLKPDPWQVAYIIAPVFGWVRFDKDADAWVRIIRRLYVEVGRKNGKSTLSGGLALYLVGGDGEPGAEVLTAATSRDQARFVFDPIKDLVVKNAALKRHFKPVGNKILHPRSGSYLQVISSISEGQHGANVHGSIVDELHVHKTPDMVETIETGTGSRTQPLNIIITTADEGKQDSIYDRRRTLIEQLAAGSIKDETQYGVIWCAEEGDDPFVESTWKKANPGYGVSPSRSYLAAAAREAQNSPSELPKFLRLHLGIRIKQVAKWLDLSLWDACGQPVDESEWRGVSAAGGLDLSTSSDFTAFALTAAHERGDLIDVLVWIPEERVEELERRCSVPIGRWVREGWIKATEGNVVDYAQVRADIEARIDRLGCSVRSIGYDPWNASETVQELETAGYQMVPVRQGYGALSPPSKLLERKVHGSTPGTPLIRHGGNPVLRWMADCVEVRTDDNGNIKPVKPDRVKSSKRIDGMVALVMAERELVLGAEVDDEESSAASFFSAVTSKCACGYVNVLAALVCGGCGTVRSSASGVG